MRDRLRRRSKHNTREATLPASGVAIEVIEAGVDRGGATLLESVSMRVGAGELVALVGPNGAGKSTLLSVLASDVVPDRGRMLIGGSDAQRIGVRDLAQLRGVMPQSSAMTFPFTVDDVVRMGRAPWAGTPSAAEDDEVVAQAIGDTDVRHLIGRIFTTLSGGEQARVMLARLLAQKTPVLLLDEPTASLDLQHQTLVLDELRRRADAGGVVIVVLHDLGLAATYADRLVVLDRGLVVVDAPPREALQAPLISQVYRQEVDVIRAPHGDGLLVVPIRRRPQVDASLAGSGVRPG